MISRILHRVSSGTLILVLLILVSCNSSINNDIPVNGTIVYEFTFSTNTEGWTGGFSDYPPGKTMDNYYEISFTYAQLPSYLGKNMFGLYISGNNHNGDLFMFVKRKFENLKPGTDYQVVFRVEIASDAPEDAVGAGDSPGSSVYLKTGAVLEEPLTFIENDYYQMNIDKGNQSAAGKDAIVLGNIGITDQNPDAPYKLKVLENHIPFAISTDETGSFWILIGTDSGFEGKTSIYYSSIKITLSEQ